MFIFSIFYASIVYTETLVTKMHMVPEILPET